VSIRRAAEAALRERLVSLGVQLDEDGRAEHLRQVVVDTVDEVSLGQAAADLREGSGGELTSTEAHRPKFHSAFSSCALAVNVFGPWRLDPASLIFGGSGFASLEFEAQRPIFSSRATPPNLDVVVEAADRVVAIESKLTEYLGGNERAAFADRYREVVDEMAHPTWGEVFTLLEAAPEHFRFLNADQLVKHYLGLKRAQQNDPRPVTLTYLYWEPLNP
jgi:Restriction Endonuclease associating with ARP